jgi:hypothetical protein
MKNESIITIMILSFIVMLGACQKEEPKPSFETIESARAQVNDNVEINARAFRQQHAEFADRGIYTRGDSTQSADCPQGDGWATIDFKSKDLSNKIEVKCSTVSAAIGCMTTEDFKTRPFAKQDGSCNADIPFPIPKIEK